MTWRQRHDPASHFWSLIMSEGGREPRVSHNLDIPPVVRVRGAKGHWMQILAACLLDIWRPGKGLRCRAESCWGLEVREVRTGGKTRIPQPRSCRTTAFHLTPPTAHTHTHIPTAKGQDIGAGGLEEGLASPANRAVTRYKDTGSSFLYGGTSI